MMVSAIFVFASWNNTNADAAARNEMKLKGFRFRSKYPVLIKNGKNQDETHTHAPVWKWATETHTHIHMQYRPKPQSPVALSVYHTACRKSFNQKSIHQIGYLGLSMNCLPIYTLAHVISFDDTFHILNVWKKRVGDYSLSLPLLFALCLFLWISLSFFIHSDENSNNFLLKLMLNTLSRVE